MASREFAARAPAPTVASGPGTGYGAAGGRGSRGAPSHTGRSTDRDPFPRRKFRRGEVSIDTSSGFVPQDTDVIVSDSSDAIRLAVGMAVAMLTTTTVSESVADSHPEAAEAEAAAAGKVAVGRVSLFATGTATASAIAALEVARRLVRGVHAIIDFGTAFAVTAWEAEEEGLEDVTTRAPLPAVRVTLVREGAVTAEDKAHPGYSTPLADSYVEASPSVAAVPVEMRGAMTEPARPKAGRGVGRRGGRPGAGGRRGGRGGGPRGSSGGYAPRQAYGGGGAAAAAAGFGMAPTGYTAGASAGGPAYSAGYGGFSGGYPGYAAAGYGPPAFAAPRGYAAAQGPASSTRRLCLAYSASDRTVGRQLEVERAAPVGTVFAQVTHAFGMPPGSLHLLRASDDRRSYAYITSQADLEAAWAMAEGAGTPLTVFVHPAAPAPAPAAPTA